MKKSATIKPILLALNDGTNRKPIFLELNENQAFTFGRSMECDLPVKDIAVSRKHCRITRVEESFSLEDLNSHNGTFVNDLPVNVHRLKHGDQIRVGNFYYMFLTSEHDDAPFVSAQFDDGTLVTNSAIRIFPNQAAADFPSDLNVLVKLGKAINEVKDSETLQRVILETILEFIPARRGAILLTRGNLTDSQAVCVPAKNMTDIAPMQISRTVSEQVLREQVALLSNDLSDKNLEKAKSLIAMRVSSLLCVPLKIGDGKGLIYLDASDPDIRFTETHLEQMTAISFLVSAALAGAESIEHLRQENAILKDNLHVETNMVGESPPLKEVLHLVGKVAPSDSTVLITGESGTGKELVARAIHQNSPRRAKSFVAINCAALNENLLESELFGHEKGAFTGAFAQKKGKLEIADGGTVFLDEIGELAPAIQVKLLRVLQEREFERVGGMKTIRVNVRVIAATNRNLEEAVKTERFRRDLFFRLNVVPIKVPPLRERKSDIPLLAQHFVHKYSELCHRKVVGLSDAARKILLKGEWTGNIRELENVIERAVVLGTNDKITPEDLPQEMVGGISAETNFDGDFNEQLRQAKQKIVVSALQNSNGNFTEAARLLNIHPNNLHRLARELGVRDNLKTVK